MFCRDIADTDALPTAKPASLVDIVVELALLDFAFGAAFDLLKTDC